MGAELRKSVKVPERRSKHEFEIPMTGDEGRQDEQSEGSKENHRNHDKHPKNDTGQPFQKMGQSLGNETVPP